MNLDVIFPAIRFLHRSSPQKHIPGIKVFWCFMGCLWMCLALPGCITPNPANTLNTPTGKADVIIPNASKAAIADKITNAMLSSDFRLETRDPELNVLTFVKSRDGGWIIRYTYNLVNHPPQGVRVVVTIIRIMWPGSREQSMTDISRNSPDAKWVYDGLMQMQGGVRQAKVTSKPAKAGIGMEMKHYVILSVSSGGLADQAGLRQGDRILKINGQPITGNEGQDAMRIIGKPGATVELLVQRNGKPVTAHLAR